MKGNPWASRVLCVFLCSTAAVATPASIAAPAAVVEQNARRGPGEVFRDCDLCPEMVVMPDGRLALGRYEVTWASIGRSRQRRGAEVTIACWSIHGETRAIRRRTGTR